ncbi:nuclear transport factor 2 family protein [Agromyces marinus]|uniref:DUF4440 domain-containing protein n=1 Tax=Agromyces marinus TaxID=1389020 RepID=A0ABM8GZY8_9MICO|nr:nuclear transport factor 2 family protein [Agromyces marinus]UIP57790.1 hypothetical protein DSM26151_06560 [Agromyces marinus]BDZ54030.1 hypothetical protein GCM10025870_11030 [Agromyces marinus]
MSEREEFLTWVNGEFVAAERALLDGDDRPRRSTWSRVEPVSALGAWRNAVGRAGLVEAFEVLASSFSDCTEYVFDLISYEVSGSMAYTVGYEHFTARIDGSPRTMTLRATQVYRRDGDGWHVVHRHADAM